MKTAILIFTLIGLTSCVKKERDAAIDYFKSQPRDPEIFGRWKLVNSIYNDNYHVVYKQDGTLVEWNPSTNQEGRGKEYYYTKNDTLYILRPAVFLKNDNLINKEIYHIKEDTLLLYSISDGKRKDEPYSYKRVK